MSKFDFKLYQIYNCESYIKCEFVVFVIMIYYITHLEKCGNIYVINVTYLFLQLEN